MKIEYRKLRSESIKRFWDKKGRKGTIGKNGYRVFSIKKMGVMNREYEHRIVWEKHFGKIPDGFQVHHKDGNKLNNNIENLELVSFKEHQRMHAKQIGLGKDRKGIPPINKTNTTIIEKIKDMRKNGCLLTEIMKNTGLSYVTVQKYAKEAL